MNRRTWFEIHAFCGDCGRRMLDKIDVSKTPLKDLLKIVKLFYVPGNMACAKCSNPGIKKWRVKR